MTGLIFVCLFPPPSQQSCTQGNHEGVQSKGGSRRFCGAALLLLHLQPTLQTQCHLDSGSLLQSQTLQVGSILLPVHKNPLNARLTRSYRLAGEKSEAFRS